MDEIIDWRLPRRHEYPFRYAVDAFAWRCGGNATRLYDVVSTESTGEDWMPFKPNYGRDRAERARAARAKSEEKLQKKEDKAALRKAEREVSEPPSDEKDSTA
jgi:hypothetical protein